MNRDDIGKFVITRTIRLAAVLALLFLLAACAGGARTDLLGSWRLLSLNGEPLVAGSEITLEISEDQLGGSGGCNQYGGRYSAAGERLRIEDLAQTEMACLDQAVTEQESAYMAILSQVEKAEVVDSQLTLSGPGGDLLYVKTNGS